MNVINRRRTYNSSLLKSKGNLGDIAIFYKGRIGFMPCSELTAPIGTPIGVVAIPSSHNVYGNGKCMVIGLREAEKKWANERVDTGLKSYSSCIYIGDNNNLNNGVPQGVASYAYLPTDSDKLQRIVASLDGITYYHAEGTYAPSPYEFNGGRNPAYYDASKGANCFSDFNGKSNTEYLVKLGAGYEAAIYCNEYKTEGTNEGDWFMPACGELGYIAVRYKLINDSISKIISLYSSFYSLFFIELKDYFSSTESTSEFVKVLNSKNIYIGSSNKTLTLGVRPCILL